MKNKFFKFILAISLLAGCALTNPTDSSHLDIYLNTFDLTTEDDATAKELELSSDLVEKGFTMKVEVSHKGSIIGVVYDGTVKGRNGDISFQLSFKDGKYNRFTIVGEHSENIGFPGADILGELDEKLSGRDAREFTSADQFYNNSDFISSATAQSTENLFPAIVAAAIDYVIVI